MRKKLYYKGKDVDHIQVIFTSRYSGYNEGEKAWFPVSIAKSFIGKRVAKIVGEKPAKQVEVPEPKKAEPKKVSEKPKAKAKAKPRKKATKKEG